MNTNQQGSLYVAACTATNNNQILFQLYHSALEMISKIIMDSVHST